MTSLPPVAFFVSPHGFGHAARAAAVMQELRRLDPEVEILVLTTAPRWFFEDSLQQPFSHFPVLTDVGLVQRDAFVEDLPKTVALLESFWDGFDAAVDQAARTLERHGVGLVV